MNFHRLLPSINLSEIGKFPQIQTGFDNTDSPSDQLSQLTLEKAGDNFVCPSGVLHQKAKITDLVSASYPGLSSKLIVSGRLNELLASVKSDGVQHLKTKLITSNAGNLEYWIIHPFISDFSVLDFAKSKIAYMNGMVNKVLEEVKFESKESLSEAYRQNRISAVGNPYPNHQPLVIIDPVFVTNSDLGFFALAPLKPGGVGFFVSDEIKEKIIANNYTGINFG